MIEESQSETWVVGPEYDDVLLGRLRRTLVALGYRVGEASWGVTGSQELSTWEARSASGSVLIQAETYVGLSVTGAAPLVGEVKQCFERSAN